MTKGQNIVQTVAMKAVIVNGSGQVLILREASTYDQNTKPGRYQLPGGRVNPGELFLDGLKREVDEETGLEIEIGKPIHVGEWRPVIKGVQNQIIGVFFVCHTSTKKISLSEEHDAYKWIEPKDTKQYDIMTPDNKVIEEYGASLSPS